MTSTPFSIHPPSKQVRRTASPSPLERPGPLRLTGRGRLVLLMAVLAIAFAVFTVVGGPADSAGSTYHPPAQTVVVQPGQTLWDIAQRAAPHEDTRTVVAELVELNSLPDGGALRAGQPLDVPQY